MIRNVSDRCELDRLLIGSQKAPNIKQTIKKALKIFENSPTQWDITDIKYIEKSFNVPCVGEFLHFKLQFKSVQNPDIEFVYKINPTVVAGESSLYGNHASQWRYRIPNTQVAESHIRLVNVETIAKRTTAIGTY